MIQLNSLYFRFKDGFTDYATPFEWESEGTIRFQCDYGNPQYKKGYYAWFSETFLEEWTPCSELHKALV
jgi:hypothetical protein